MLATNVDSKRRATLPPRFVSGSPITITDVDADAILIRRVRPKSAYKLVVLPVVERLPDDPEMDAFALAVARHCTRHLPEPKA